MKLSKKFLSEYIDTSKIDFKELAEKMVFMGNEYDEYKKMCDASGLVVGYVYECEKHPDSEKLSICQVDIGTKHQIICGAPNVKKGQKVVVAKVGSILPGNFEIKKAKLAGTYSDGMICSLAELGADKKFLREEDIEGIMELEADAPIGVDAVEYLDFNDEIIDFELTTDRADLLSVLGMAYEVGAIYDLEVKYPDVDYKETKNSIKDKFSLKVETENCMLYLAKLVENVVVKDSPQFIRNRLMASGIRPINNVVDISNYVMLETGQPLHFFDADKLNKIGVRMGRGEEFKTLDNKVRKVGKDDILITNDDEPIGLAGVMGGLDTEVTKETKNIIIESAIFNPKNIRNTSKKILRSEASMRFEKGVVKERSYLALKRACYLLEKYAEGSVAKDTLVHDEMTVSEKTISISVEKVNKILGMNLTEKEILNVFDKLQLPYSIKENIEVLVPSRRMDLSIPEDLIEEVGRVVGFNNVVGELPTVPIKKGGRNLKSEYIKKVKEFMIGKGLNQNINYSLVSEEESKLFSDIENKVKILEPISKEREVLRTSIVQSLVTAYKYNASRKIKNINIFEIGAVYSKEEEFIEEQRLACLLSGNYLENRWQNKLIEVDFYILKGIIEELLEYLGFKNRYEISTSKLKDMHPGRCASVFIDRKEVGFLGQVHPSLAKDAYVFEVNIEKLFEFKMKPIKYKEPSKYPSVVKDLAFIVDLDVESSKIENIIRKAGSRMLSDVEVFDVYIDDKVSNKKSIAYSLIFKDETKTLNDEEVMIIFKRIIEAVEEKANAKLKSE